MRIAESTRSRDITPLLVRHLVTALLACLLAREVARAQTVRQSSDGPRTERVLNGLRPPVVIEGRRPVTTSITAEMAAQHVPGMSIAVIDDGKIAWTRALGVKEAGSTAPVTTSTLFEAQSISKAVTATAVLRLTSLGQLDLDQSPNSYLKSWKIPYNELQAQQPVTIREVLSHSSGLNVGSFEGYRNGEDRPTLEQILDGKSPAKNPPIRVEFTPGTMFRYSGGGAEVMQQLLTDITGQPFPELMERVVLGPVGMTSSTYEQPLPDNMRNKAASGHDGDGGVIRGKWPIQPEMAAAGLWTTPTDLAKWALAITKSWKGDNGAILTRQTAKQMLTIQKAPYGLGVELQGSGPALEFSHGGSNSGFRALVVMFPAVGKGAVVMANGDRADAVIGDLITSIASEYHWPSRGQAVRAIVPLREAQLENLVGIYSLPPGPSGAPVTYEVTREGTRLFAQIKGLASYPKGEIFPSSASEFFNLGGIDTAFTLDGAGRATSLRFGSITGVRKE